MEGVLFNKTRLKRKLLKKFTFCFYLEAEVEPGFQLSIIPFNCCGFIF